MLGTVLSQPDNVVPGRAPGAAVQAQKCFFPVSTWVHAFILTCDGKLAVWFKRGVHHHHHVFGGVPGACCLYPTSNVLLFDLACTWPGAGEFVWRFLYRKLPYQLVAPPKAPCGGDCPGGVQGACCPNSVVLPQTLHATATGGLSGSGALTWNGAAWTGKIALCLGLQANVTLACSGTQWFLFVAASDGGSCAAPGQFASSASCSPLSLTFNLTGNAGCCNGVAFTVTVTT
jgi:hypothetical protein